MKKIYHPDPRTPDPLDELRACDDSDQSLATELWSQRAMLTRYLRSRIPEGEDADDFVQEAYLRLLSMNKERQSEITDLPGFLVRTASNLLKDSFRRRRSRKKDMHLPIESAHSIADENGFNGERALSARQELEWVEQDLKTTDHEARKALFLVRVEGKSHAAAAKELGVEKKRVSRLIEIALYRLSRQKIARERRIHESSDERLK